MFLKQGTLGWSLMPNSFSEDDEKVAKLEKEIKSLKAQIDEFKGMIADVKKVTEDINFCLFRRNLAC